MSRHQTIRAIKSEIARLNQEIDLRIIRGMPYRQEARRHLFLTRQLKRLAPRRAGWLGGAFPFMSSFSH
ncbi:MAG: hypothetical protein KGI69_02995 [Patescibacteria group bacterium]|nr:hypothetical protein [Patescibacteria group bacterium]